MIDTADLRSLADLLDAVQESHPYDRAVDDVKLERRRVVAKYLPDGWGSARDQNQKLSVLIGQVAKLPATGRLVRRQLLIELAETSLRWATELGDAS